MRLNSEWVYGYNRGESELNDRIRFYQMGRRPHTGGDDHKIHTLRYSNCCTSNDGMQCLLITQTGGPLRGDHLRETMILRRTIKEYQVRSRPTNKDDH